MDHSNEISVEPLRTRLRNEMKGKERVSNCLLGTSLPFKLSQTQPCIYKVHKHLRNINDKAYEPHIIAIGPYHSGKDNLQMMEDHKLRYFQSLLHRKNQNVDLYISAIGELEKLARSCYSERISLNASQFIEMLVLDGCFIIELLRICFTKDFSDHENDPIFQILWIVSSLQRDLILFENQIPFFVLCKLFDLIEQPNQRDKLIRRILFFCHNLYPSWEIRAIGSEAGTELDLGVIKHLLHLIHDSWRPLLSGHVQNKVDSIQTGVNADVQSDADPLRTGDVVQIEVDSERELRFNIPSATELTKANVSFSKRKLDDNLKRVNLFQIDFKKGVLVMPQLMFHDYTESLFRNLIAYEQYFPDERGNFVTDYAIFMDSLINTSEDVEILSKSKIIDNHLGDNEVLVGIFNKLTDSVVFSEKRMYSGIVNRVNEHYERPWNHAMAVLRRDYFNSPWAYIAFFSAVLLLLLTAGQTVSSVLQL